MTLGLKYLLCIDGKIFDFNKLQTLCILSCNKCILVRLLGQLFLSQGWVQAEITMQTL